MLHPVKHNATIFLFSSYNLLLYQWKYEINNKSILLVFKAYFPIMYVIHNQVRFISRYSKKREVKTLFLQKGKKCNQTNVGGVTIFSFRSFLTNGWKIMMIGFFMTIEFYHATIVNIPFCRHLTLLRTDMYAIT